MNELQKPDNKPLFKIDPYSAAWHLFIYIACIATFIIIMELVVR